MTRTLLILGGTIEASRLAQAVAARGERAVLSYAGRVERPKAQPTPVRVGGFGGVAGLAEYLRGHGVTHVVDATHPFAAQMSRNAVLAAAQTGTPLLALTRPPWKARGGDLWTQVPDIPAAVTTLSGPPRRVLLALGRMHLAAFAAQPQHSYILRLVDPPEIPPPLPDHTIIVSRGPFEVASDMALIEAHRVELIVAKNAGGAGAAAKLHAARALGMPVILIDRPPLPERAEARTVAEVLHWLDHAPTDLGV